MWTGEGEVMLVWSDQSEGMDGARKKGEIGQRKYGFWAKIFPRLASTPGKIYYKSFYLYLQTHLKKCNIMFRTVTALF